MKKKVIAAVLAALLLCGGLTVSALGATDTEDDTFVLNADNNYTLDLELNLKGDVNMDGEVNILDHQCLFEHLQEIAEISDDYQLSIANVDEDENNEINILDHQRLFEHLQDINPLT